MLFSGRDKETLRGEAGDETREKSKEERKEESKGVTITSADRERRTAKLMQTDTECRENQMEKGAEWGKDRTERER